jgi:hypothetical protein
MNFTQRRKEAGQEAQRKFALTLRLHFDLRAFA